MTRFPCWLCLVALGSSAVAETRVIPQLQTGDVVLQTSRSSQSRAIQEATRSPYSHVGIVEVTARGIFVVEAIQPVSRTPWAKWEARGKGGRVLVMRASSLDAQTLAKVVDWAKAQLGRPYDAQFKWDDERLYCSELVYKAFKRIAGIEVGKMERLDSLHLERLAKELAKRYRGKVPKNLELVTPASIAEDDDLAVIWSSFPER